MTNKKLVINTGLFTLTLYLAACGGSGSKPASPEQPPVVVEPSGLSLEQVVEKFGTVGSNLTQNVTGNVSYGSGSDVAAKDFSFSVENSNGSKVCVNYSGQDSTSAAIDSFKFNSLDCDKGLVVGGKADLDKVVGDFVNYSASPVVNSPVSAGYDIFNGAKGEVEYKVSNGDVLSCTDSATGTSSYVSLGYYPETGMSNMFIMPGVYPNEESAGEEFTVSCDVRDNSGNMSTIEDIAKYKAEFSSVPASRLVDIIAAESGATVVGRDVQTYLVKNIGDDLVVSTCDGVLENSYGTRACIDVGSDNDSLVKADIVLNSEGMDYSVSGVNYSNASEVSSDLVSRLGTPVLKEVKNNSIANLYQDVTPATFEIRNVDTYDATCELNSQHDEIQGMPFNALYSETSANGFAAFSIEQFQENYSPISNPDYLDENNNYNLGNLNCTFSSSILGDNVKINDVLSISGNNDQDKINFP